MIVIILRWRGIEMMCGTETVLQFGDDVCNTIEHIPNMNIPVAFSKGTWAVKLCLNKTLQFLTEGVS